MAWRLHQAVISRRNGSGDCAQRTETFMSSAAQEEMESAFDEFETDEFEFEASTNGEFEETFETNAPFSEVEEMELAAELLEVNDEAELDQFLGKLLKKASRAVGGALKSPLGRTLGGYLKGAIKKALPKVGGVLGNYFVPGVGGAIGSRLASRAGQFFGLEMEGLSPEDQEFEVARRLVRFGGEAARYAGEVASHTARSQYGRPGNLAQTVQQSLMTAAQKHAPGFIRTSGNPAQSGEVSNGPGTCHCGGHCGRHGNGHESGNWVRRGREIYLLEV
jgi:hypothetical protein